MTYTKIVATLGPETSNDKSVEELIKAGVDVFRLNFSHGAHAEHKERIDLIRRVSRKIGIEVALLQDLCGPKIRTGKMQPGGVLLAEGAKVSIVTENVIGTEERFSCIYELLTRDVHPGEKILLDDGSMELRVDSVDKALVLCTVIRGGLLKSSKGMNLPGSKISSPALTDKDRDDLEFGLREKVDFVALSFVRDANDIRQLRNIVGAKDIRIIAKIEKPEAIAHIDEIIHEADGVMVARGDLGVEMDLAEVPLLQKQIIHKANAADRYVITATQMLESMIESPFPTRAEVTDVANAVIDGTDAVMLSGETAVGKYPIVTVKTMKHIARTTEKYLKQHPPKWNWVHINTSTEVHNAISRAVLQFSRDLAVKAICAYSPSGGTSVYLSKSRPFAPIIIFTPSIEAVRRMHLYWGVIPVLDTTIKSKEELERKANEFVQEREFAIQGDTILLIHGSVFGQVGKNSIIEIKTVEGILKK
ncbi:pyruvate kinase [Candidatus Magnetominusculus xianensis]|uniref:Pyruvate kinase n=1 Tax=Candidatus Magnetominusculus xianensis TaxID=1748249 RepID=A0ABR5SJ37_9BACT|nr:pyruvate kinase [Candidatus Magnetominusculus xianensis]KWT93551.1 pyruvate kinase [Candidatus Magnetominusculus xianensis]MBF0405681.1 pyruvate kinase [Nitrospirota bacterium]